MNNEKRQAGRSKPRKPRGRETELEQSLSKRLAAYALAAGGAGLGIMTGAQPAEAQIVYTPANIHFEKGAALDLNNDGVTDFIVRQNWSCPTTCTFYQVFAAQLRVGGAQAPGNGVLLGSGYAARLPRGAKIGLGGYFGKYSALMAMFFSTFNWGFWQKGAGGFLGFQFQIDGKTHYGWAEVFITAGNPGEYRGVIKGYAYNTLPNQPILAGQMSGADWTAELPPQSATLGLLALGAPGLDIWRPRKQELMAD